MTLEMGLRKGLVGHWTLNTRDTQNGTLRDQSGNENHGTLNGGVTTDQSSPNSQSYTFDETDDFISVPETNSLKQTFPITISAWINIETGSGGSHRTILGKRGGSSATPYALRLSNGSSSHDICYYFGDGSWQSFYHDAGFATETWYHIAVTVSSSGSITMYVDGQSVNTMSTTTSPTNSSINVGIGSHNGNSANEQWAGGLSDIRLYRRELKSHEVNALAQMRSPRTADV